MNNLPTKPLTHPNLWIRLCNRPATKWALGLLFFVLILSLFGPLYSSRLPSDIQLAYKNMPPCADFWFGTDDLGRDLFVRVCWGARISLFVSITATILDTIIGVLWAAIAVHMGGKWEKGLMRVCNILHAIPYLLLVMFLTFIRGPGLTTILMAMTLTGWISIARIVRSHMLQVKEQEYIMAAKTLGASSSRIVFFYLIPNSFSLILATMTLHIPSAMFTEAFLSFLGLGVEMPSASWGVMINEGIGAISYYPWRLFFPALFITTTTLAFYLLAQTLHDEL